MPTKIDFIGGNTKALPYSNGTSDDCRYVFEYDV